MAGLEPMLPFSKGGSSQLELEPFQEGTLGTSQEKQCCPGFVSACSNFSIQYNYTSASIAAAIMLSDNDNIGTAVKPDFPQPAWVGHYLLGAVFMGSVVGMLLMGYLGDLLGIRPALILANGLTAMGALTSSLLSWGPPDTVWTVIIASRLLLGVGVGGNYPLSAAKAAESGKDLQVNAAEAANKAAYAFFWQGPGQLAPYMCAITSLQFRFLLGIGAVPAGVVLLRSWQEETNSSRLSEDESIDRRAELRNRRHWWTLIGTAGSWFFFDVAFYGTVIFSPTILLKVFGEMESLPMLSIQAAAMITVTIIGNAGSLAVVPRLGAKALNTMGLALCGLAFTAFASVYRYCHDWHTLQFCLLCAVNLALSLPNIATFMLPVLLFPRNVRSTFHGISAAAAKVGAMVGTILFPALEDYGIPVIMFTQAVLCGLGAACSHWFLDESISVDAEPHNDQVGKKQRTVQLVPALPASACCFFKSRSSSS
ncbi:unnamed protein product [Durusdinium trenchii]|uniref:Major facilitator superfamily (MFS) profile domain-containing protein n=1 Tax=Durusdinium trenchii TaxID=1381693 RepID=A0ABP0K9Y7_9DINO